MSTKWIKIFSCLKNFKSCFQDQAVIQDSGTWKIEFSIVWACELKSLHGILLTMQNLHDRLEIRSRKEIASLLIATCLLLYFLEMSLILFPNWNLFLLTVVYWKYSRYVWKFTIVVNCNNSMFNSKYESMHNVEKVLVCKHDCSRELQQIRC